MRLSRWPARLAPIPAAIVVGLAAASLLAHHGAAPATRADRWPLTGFTERDVTVELAVERDSTGGTWLAGTYTPTRPAFHLYGKDLPQTGISGVGRPTRLGIVSCSAIRAVGSLAADQPTHDLFVPMLGLTLPVYPEGPVTLRLPVTFDAGDDAVAELSVTYMACSSRKCLPPVVDRRVAVTLPVAAITRPRRTGRAP
jgi:hypothetical protein